MQKVTNRLGKGIACALVEAGEWTFERMNKIDHGI